jgi:hypothetical protein
MTLPSAHSPSGEAAVAAVAPRQRSRWARLGLAGFLFFLLKGLLWLLVPALVARGL